MLGNVGMGMGEVAKNVKRDWNNDGMLSISEFLLCISIEAEVSWC